MNILKKLLLIIMTINISLFAIVVEPLQAHAIGSKVTSKVAVKVAKEVIQDSAVSLAEDIIFHYQMEQLLSDKYKVDDGYTAVCLDNKTDCKKPAQVKKTITSTDKDNLGRKVEELLEKKSGTHSGWGKWLDWIVPIFLVGTAVNWLISVLDPDTENLFDQVAKEGLEETGIIKPLPLNTNLEITSDGVVLPESLVPDNTFTYTGTKIQIPKENNTQINELIFNNSNIWEHKFSMDMTGVPQRNVAMIIDLALPEDINNPDIMFNGFNYYDNQYSVSSGTPNASRFIDGIYPGVLWSGYGSNGQKSILYLNGEVVKNDRYNTDLEIVLTEQTKAIYDEARWIMYNVKRIIIEYEYINSNNHYESKVHYIAKDGRTLTHEVAHNYPVTTRNMGTAEFNIKTRYTVVNKDFKVRVMVLPNTVIKQIPLYTPELNIDYPESALDLSDLKNPEDNTFKVIPPTAIPIETPDGTKVKADETSSTGWIDISTGEDITVNEDELVISDPIRTPDGIQMPDGTIIPDETTPPEEEQPTTPDGEQGIKEEDFEALGCVKPNNINFSPIGESFTTSFPFSIPWDIKRFVDNAFGGIGNERPSIKLGFLGDDVVLEIPEYFDNWIPFTNALIILSFDIGLIFLFYRFMKGGGD